MTTPRSDAVSGTVYEAKSEMPVAVVHGYTGK
jgi:hypothetical protein